MTFSPTDLMIEPDGRIYHLQLLPEELADTIVVVGDPGRVPLVSQHFDSITVKQANREYLTHTGTYQGMPISVISTGIGIGNIDIVMSELDALANIDLVTRKVKENTRSLQIIRIGTSGSLDEKIPINSFLLARYAVDMSNLLTYYQSRSLLLNTRVQEAWQTFLKAQEVSLPESVIIEADQNLTALLSSEKTRNGITLSSPGFYGPQARSLRLASTLDKEMISHLTNFNFDDVSITNFEMEGATLMGLGSMMGHQVAMVCLIAAHRFQETSNLDYHEKMDELISYVLDRLVSD